MHLKDGCINGWCTDMATVNAVNKITRQQCVWNNIHICI